MTLGKIFTSQTLLKPFADLEPKDYSTFSIELKRRETLKHRGLVGFSIEKNSQSQRVDFKAENQILLAIGIFGGVAAVLFVVLAHIDRWLTGNKFENYLASELFCLEKSNSAVCEPAIEVPISDPEAEASRGCCSWRATAPSVSRKRSHIPKDFFNEITGEDEEILDRS